MMDTKSFWKEQGAQAAEVIPTQRKRVLAIIFSQLLLALPLIYLVLLWSIELIYGLIGLVCLVVLVIIYVYGIICAMFKLPQMFHVYKYVSNSFIVTLELAGTIFMSYNVALCFMDGKEKYYFCQSDQAMLWVLTLRFFICMIIAIIVRSPIKNFCKNLLLVEEAGIEMSGV